MVIIIIFILIAYWIPLIGNMQERAKVVKTNTIMSMVIQGLATTAAERGTSLAAVEHPLAASATVSAEGAFAASLACGLYTLRYRHGGSLKRQFIADFHDVCAAQCCWLDSPPGNPNDMPVLFNDPVAPQFIGLQRWKRIVLGIGSYWYPIGNRCLAAASGESHPK